MRAIFLLFNLLPITFVTHAAETHVCPGTMTLSTASLSAPLPEGFVLAISRSPLRLTGINLFDGPPEQNAALIPVSEKQSRTKGKVITVSVWRFVGGFPQGKYLSCDFAQGMVRATVRISDQASTCTARTTRLSREGTLTASFVCE